MGSSASQASSKLLVGVCQNKRHYHAVIRYSADPVDNQQLPLSTNTDIILTKSMSDKFYVVGHFCLRHKYNRYFQNRN